MLAYISGGPDTYDMYSTYRCNNMRCGAIQVLIPQDRRQVHTVVRLQQARHSHQQLERGTDLLVNERLEHTDAIIECVVFCV